MEEDVAWMRDLQWQIWDKPTPYRDPRSPPAAPTVKRVITHGEWDRIRSAIEHYTLPTRIFNVNFGFGIALNISGHAIVPEGEAEFLLAISYEQLPGMPEDRRELWDAAWHVFEAIVRREANLKILAQYRMEPPHDRDRLEY